MIILVGMPGSGESTAGRQVARRLHLPLWDVDHLIEKKIGMSIKDYFAEHGETAFRDLETATLRELLEQGTPAVLSTGGGAVLREENRALLRQGGTVLYLRAQPDDIFRNIRHDTKRPLLQVANPRARLHELFQQRDPLYRATAHYVIETGRNSVMGLANHIVMQVEMAQMAHNQEQQG